MAKKDLRNGKESGRWQPHKWSTFRAYDVRRHALTVAYNDLSVEFGPFEATKSVAQIYAGIDAALSKEMLNDTGVKSIGA